MRRIWIILGCATLAACGVDGEPVQPQAAAQVSLSNSGVHLAGVVGVRQGPFSLGLGF